MKLIVYTDGACSGNGGADPGGWGVYMVGASLDHRMSGGKKSTTNNQMELQAVIEALKIVPPDMPVKIVSDSMYVINGIDWSKGWMKRGWKTSSNQPVKNVEQWKLLTTLLASRSVAPQFEWVKGHSGDKGNEEADRLATSAIPRR